MTFVVPRYGAGIVGRGRDALPSAWPRTSPPTARTVEVLTTCAVDHFTWADHHPAGHDGGGRRAGAPLRREPPRATRTSAGSYHTAIAQDHPLGYAAQLEWMANGAWSEGSAARRVERAPRLAGSSASPTCSARPSGSPRRAAGPHRGDPVHARRALRPPAAWCATCCEGVDGCMADRRASGGWSRELAPAARDALVGVGFDEPAGAERRGESASADRAASPPATCSTPGAARTRKGVPVLFRHYAAAARNAPRRARRSR